MALHLPVIFQVLIFLVLFGMAVTFMGTGYDNFIVGIAQLTGDGFLQDDAKEYYSNNRVVMLIPILF